MFAKFSVHPESTSSKAEQNRKEAELQLLEAAIKSLTKAGIFKP